MLVVFGISQTGNFAPSSAESPHRGDCPVSQEVPVLLCSVSFTVSEDIWVCPAPYCVVMLSPLTEIAQLFFATFLGFRVSLTLGSVMERCGLGSSRTSARCDVWSTAVAYGPATGSTGGL